MTPPVEQIKQLQGLIEQSFEELGDKVDAHAKAISEQSSEVSKHAKSIEDIEERIGHYQELKREIDEASQKYTELQGLIGPGGSKITEGESKSVGQMFVESEQFKSRGRSLRTDPVEFRSWFDKKTVSSDVGTAPGQAGHLIEPYRLPELITDPRRTFSIRDLMRVIPTSVPGIEIIRATGFSNFYTTLAANIAAAATTAILNGEVHHVFDGQTLNIDGETRQVAPDGVADNGDGTITVTVTVAFANAHSTGAPVTSDQLGATPHGGRKPQANLAFGSETVTISTIAHWIPIHRQTLDDISVLSAMIDSELTYGLGMVEEDQILFGNGESGNLLGLMNRTAGNVQGARAIQNQGAMSGGDQQLDWIRRAVTKAEVAQYPVNGIVMNPIDWEAIELLKDANGNYLYVTVNAGRERRVWQVPVVTTTAMPAGQFLVGAFGLGAYLFDREQANVRSTESHGNLFIENTIVVLAEERLGLGVPRPEAFIRGSFG